jgi:hypothetical protein
MTTADIAALRAKVCKVHAELGAALLQLEDTESHLQHGFHQLAHETAESAAAAFESAAAHLAEVITAADQAADRIRPVGTPSDL